MGVGWKRADLAIEGGNEVGFGGLQGGYLVDKLEYFIEHLLFFFVFVRLWCGVGVDVGDEVEKAGLVDAYFLQNAVEFELGLDFFQLGDGLKVDPQHPL